MINIRLGEEGPQNVFECNKSFMVLNINNFGTNSKRISNTLHKVTLNFEQILVNNFPHNQGGMNLLENLDLD